LHCEPEDAFLPLSEGATASIRLHDVRELFEARAAVEPLLAMPKFRGIDR
jgi:hypothetical protein